MTWRGLYGLTVPAWLGGPDLPMSAVAEVLRILATGDPNLAQLPHSHYVYVNLLRRCGSRDQQRELLSAVREGAREFDFLRGQESYKYEWGAVDKPAYRWTAPGKAQEVTYAGTSDYH